MQISRFFSRSPKRGPYQQPPRVAHQGPRQNNWSRKRSGKSNSPYLKITHRGGPMKTIDLLFEESGYSVEEIAAQAGLGVDRIAAIAVGRWTPSSTERQKVAAAFGVPVDQISWGHTMDPRNIRYQQYGLKENF